MKSEETTEVDEVEEGERTELPKGFISKEEWVAKGRNPDDWRDPEEWQKRGDEILPIVKDKLTKTEKELEKLKADMDQVLKYTKKSEERARADERNKVIQEYETKKKKAFEEDDMAALNSAEKERDDKLKVIDEAQVPVQSGQEDPVFVDWKDKNAWYATDAEMQNWADTTGANFVQAEMKGGKSFKDALDEVSLLAKAKFPSKFENPNRDNPPSVETEATTTTKRGNGKSWDNIPKTDQKAYFRNKENMKLRYNLEYKKEDFVRDYFS